MGYVNYRIVTTAVWEAADSFSLIAMSLSKVICEKHKVFGDLQVVCKIVDYHMDKSLFLKFVDSVILNVRKATNIELDLDKIEDLGDGDFDINLAQKR